MKQVTRSLLALTGLAVVGGGALWFASRTTGGENDAKPSRLVAVEEKDISAVDIRVDGGKYRLEKRRQGWVIVAKTPIAAAPKKISELLNGFAHLRVVQRLTPEETPSESDMGLEGPGALTAVFHRHGAREVTVTIGRSNAFDKNTFARFNVGDDGANVVLLSPSARARFAKPASLYFDRRPLGIAPEQLRSIEVIPTEPGEGRMPYTVARDGEAGRWNLTQPDVGEADPFVVRQLVEGLNGTRISQFPSLSGGSELARFGLEPPLMTVKVKVQVSPDESAPLVERTLLVSAPVNPEEPRLTDQTVRIARGDQPWVAEVSAILLHALPRPIDDLKSKRLSWVSPGNVARIELVLLASGKITLERGSEKPPTWRMLSPEPGEASAQKVGAILLALSTLSGVSREAEGESARDPSVLARTGLGDDADHVRFYDPGGAVILDLLLGKVDAGSRFARVEGGGIIVRVPVTKFRDLPNKATELFK